jgi:hypothetical protein
MALDSLGPLVAQRNDRTSGVPPSAVLTGPHVQGPHTGLQAQATASVPPTLQNSLFSQTQNNQRASLTVLTLPPLNVNQTPQSLNVARAVMDEANSLLSLYSNLRLAFSVQDMQRR